MTLFCVPVLLLHISTGLILVIHKCRPHGLLGFGRRHSLVFVMAVAVLGSLLSHAHYQVFA